MSEDTVRRIQFEDETQKHPGGESFTLINDNAEEFFTPEENISDKLDNLIVQEEEGFLEETSTLSNLNEEEILQYSKKPTVVAEETDFLIDIFSKSDLQISHSFSTIENEEVIEEIPEAVELELENEEKLDRDPYYKDLSLILEPYILGKLANNLYSRSMVEYFKKRHMDHVFKEVKTADRKKYREHLFSLGKLLKREESETEVINTELAKMRDDVRVQEKKVKVMTNDLINRLKNIATGLIFRKTGKEISDKLVQHLLKRQQSKIKELHELRTNYIKKRNIVGDLEKKVQQIEIVAKGCTLQLYTKLKLDNRQRADKLELEEGELDKLRLHARHALQELAHCRQKSWSLTEDIFYYKNEISKLNRTISSNREILGSKKTERDNFRKKYQILFKNAGLLKEPALLRDFAEMEEGNEKLRRKVLACQISTNSEKRGVRNLRKKLEVFKKQPKM